MRSSMNEKENIGIGRGLKEPLILDEETMKMSTIPEIVLKHQRDSEKRYAEEVKNPVLDSIMKRRCPNWSPELTIVLPISRNKQA